MNYKVFTRDGKYITMLNPALVEKQRLSEDTVEQIKALHVDQYEIMQEMKHTNRSNKSTLHIMNSALIIINAKLQEAWGFPLDSGYFRFWEVPHCLCPRYDNEPQYPIGPYWKNDDCPVHGSLKEKYND